MDLKAIDCSTCITYCCVPWSQRPVAIEHLTPVRVFRVFPSLFLSIVSVFLPSSFLSGHGHVVTFLYTYYVVSSDERLLMLNTDLSRTERAAKRTPNWARTIEVARHKSGIASGCVRYSKLRKCGVSLTHQLWAVSFFFSFFSKSLIPRGSGYATR